MNNGGEAADQMVREGIQITEAAVKLSALGAKNLAAIALALAKDNPKVRGRTRLNRLLRDGKELKVFQIKAGDLTEFKRQANHYGVLFSAIRDKTSGGELIDVLARAEDVSKLNRIFERMGYPMPERKVIERKKEPARRPSENGSMTRGLGARETGRALSDRAGQRLTGNAEKPSVREALSRMREKAAKQAERTISFAEKEMADETKTMNGTEREAR